jgi:hypothetical protein
MSCRPRFIVALAAICSTFCFVGAPFCEAQTTTNLAPKGKAHLRPPKLPEIKPPELADDRVTVKLPGVINASAVGGGGRYVILHLKSLRQLAVFDVNAGKIVKYLALDSDDVAFTAGAEHIVVLLRDKKVIQRWRLGTFEKELTKAFSKAASSLVMGCASNGPIFVSAGESRGPYEFLDLDTLGASSITSTKGGYGVDGGIVRASADGRVFTARRTGGSPTGLQSYVLTGSEVTSYYEHDSVGEILPNEDGSLLYTGRGIYTSQLKRVGTTTVSGGIPSVRGVFYLKPPADSRSALRREGGGPLSLCVAGDTRTLASIPDALGKRDRYMSLTVVDRAVMRRVLIPDADLVVSVPWTNDRLVLQRIHLDEALRKSDIDYLFVTSRPVVEAERGKRYEYSLSVKSRSGDVAYQVAAGPEGMKVSKEGVVSWTPPAELSDDQVDVILHLRDGSGQELFQTFSIALRGEVKSASRVAGPAKPAEPATTNKPRPTEPGAAQASVSTATARPGFLLPRIEPVSFEGEQITVKLPGTFDRVKAAGGGRFLILHLVGLRQLAVFDVTRTRIVKYLPVDSDDVIFAAGSDRVIVALRDKKILQRFSLRTMKREASIPYPGDDSFVDLAMGNASEGPVAAVVGGRAGSRIMLLDGTSLTPLRVNEAATPRANVARAYASGRTINASANGRLFMLGGSAIVYNGAAIEYRTGKGSPSPSILSTPNADGTVIYSGGGLYDDHLNNIGEARPAGWKIPSVQPGYYLSLPMLDTYSFSGVPKDSLVAIHLEGDKRPLVNVRLPIKLSMEQRSSMNNIFERIWFVPDAKAIIQVPAVKSHLLVHRVDIDALLEEADIDYLFVSSRPPGRALLGKTLKYSLKIRSKRGGVKCSLASGPKGMEVSTEGLVTWTVPEDHPNTPEQVVINVTDDSQQEVLHRFTLNLPEVAEREAALLAAEVARREAEARARRQAAMAEKDRAMLEQALSQAEAALTSLNASTATILQRSRGLKVRRSPLSPMRTWTDIDGNQIEASLVEIFAGQASFRRSSSSQLLMAPLQRLREDDRAYAKKLAAEVVQERLRQEAEFNSEGAKIRAPLLVLGEAIKTSTASNRGVLPAAYNCDSSRKPLLSWRVHLLPYIGGRDLHRLFRLDQPWDSPHNKQLLRYMPDVYRAFKSEAGEGKTNFLAVRGEKCLFNNYYGIRAAQATDGLSNTAAVVEVPDKHAVEWTRPDDWEYSGPEAIVKLTGMREGGFYALLGDGTVKFISLDNGAEAIAPLFTRDDGETLNLD